jgi:ADP-heptose:LPS heptosyltransferase
MARGKMRILVMRPGALGDVLLTLPALQALSAAYPHASIELMGNPAVLEWLPGRSVVHAVSSFDRADLAALFQDTALPAAALQEYLDSFDLIVSYATAPDHVLARNLLRLARGRVLLLDARHPPGHMHMSVYLQQPLRQLEIVADGGNPSLHLTLADHQEAVHWWQAQGLQDAPAVAIHPGSGSPAKNWPAERFAAVASHLRRKLGARVLLLSGSADAAAVANVRQCMNDLRSAAPAAGSPLPLEHDPILLRELPLPLLAAILSRCQVYVGNDSGISHLAAVLGSPTVTIFGPTDPDLWAPRGPAVRVVRAATPCAPCTRSRRQECPERVCLEDVSVAMVMEALVTLTAHE